MQFNPVIRRALPVVVFLALGLGALDVSRAQPGLSIPSLTAPSPTAPGLSARLGALFADRLASKPQRQPGGTDPNDPFGIGNGLFDDDDPGDDPGGEPSHVIITDPAQLPPSMKAHFEQMSPAQRASFLEQLQAGQIRIPAAMTRDPTKDESPKTPEQREALALLNQLTNLGQLGRTPNQVLRAMARQLPKSKAGGVPEKNVALPKPPATATQETSNQTFRRFHERVIVGDWNGIKQQLDTYPPQTAKRIYSHLLVLLGNSGATLPPSAVIVVADAAPAQLDRQQLASLGQMLQASVRRVDKPEIFLKKLDSGSRRLGGKNPKSQIAAARLLIYAEMMDEAAKYLPPLKKVVAEKNLVQLNLHAQYQMTIARMDADEAAYRRVWDLSQMVLAAEWKGAEQKGAEQKGAEQKSAEYKEAFSRALSLLNHLPRETTGPWLRGLFETQPRLGMRLLANISRAVDMAYFRSPSLRAELLKTLQCVLDELMIVARKEPERWTPAIQLLALGWINEAQKTVGGKDRKMLRADDHKISPLTAGDLLPLAPNDMLLEVLDRDTARHLRRLTGITAVRAGDKKRSFAVIREIAAYDREAAKELAEGYVRTWARQRDSQADAEQQYMRRFGGHGLSTQQMQQLRWSIHSIGHGSDSGIPLTRARQVRNLTRFANLLEEIVQLNLPPLDDEVLVSAFTDCHSPAEVYRAEDIERVFGPLSSLAVKTAISLANSMRTNLAGIWRQPDIQQQSQTRRTDKDLIAEINRGYRLTLKLLAAAVEREPDNPDSHSLVGTVYFDHAEFLYGQQANLETYIKTRDRAFAGYRRAHEAYMKRLPKLKLEDQSAAIYLQWFQSALGASDLAYLTRQDEPDHDQIDQIVAAMGSLGEEASERHVRFFGEALGNSLSEVPGQLKPWFLREALRILGDHASAKPIRELLELYQELLAEIELHIQIDGSADVGHTQPFGAHLFIRSTTAVGRESGGFTMLLGEYYSQSTREQFDYKERIEKEIRDKLSEGFEIKQVRFHDPTVMPRAFGREGWRQTPIAYLVLRAKDPAIDRIPSVQVDLEFADGHGTVLLPINSQVQLISARDERVGPRPYTKLELKQTLDDRKLSDGLLRLEVTATAKGLIPSLEELFDISAGEDQPAVSGFTVKNIEDAGLSVGGLDASGEEVMPLCERTWMVELVPRGQDVVREFRFPDATVDTAEVIYACYDDADIVDTGQVVELRMPTQAARQWLWLGLTALAGVVVLGAGSTFALRLRRRTKSQQQHPQYQRPDPLTPFTVLTVLKRLNGDKNAGLSVEQRAELSATIDNLQAHYFSHEPDQPLGDDGSANGELEELLESWFRRFAGAKRLEHEASL